MRGVELKLLRHNAPAATRFLKALANRNRLMILCNLIDGEKSVGQLERSLGLRQPTMSQQLARLRQAELVETRRDSKSVYYSIADRDIGDVLDVLYGKFCRPRRGRPRTGGRRAKPNGRAR
jgi:ArsR family transcriptional regulator